MRMKLRRLVVALGLGLALLPVLPLARGQYLMAYDTNAFDKIFVPSSKLSSLATGFKFVEGPVWIPKDGGLLIFSDIPAGELKCWSVESDEISVYRQPSNGANGNCLDLDGRVISAEHEGRRLSIQQTDGTWAVLVDSVDGKKFNSPNDVVVKQDGTVWFTDPDYGLAGRPKEVAGNYVYRFDPKTKRTTVVSDALERPNGICFSPDEKRLYVADSGSQPMVVVFDVHSDGTLGAGLKLCDIKKGVPDGMRCDADGRLYVAVGDGVRICDPEGKLLAKILVPETPANLCFGGKDFKTLFVTAKTSLYAIRLGVRGAAARTQNVATR